MSHRRSNRWRQRLVYIAWGAAIIAGCGAYYRHSWASSEELSRAIDPFCMVPYCDFTLYYYKQAQQIREQDTPIKKYFYSPTFALLLRPLGQLSWERALIAWSWVQALSLLLLIVASALLLHGFPPWTHALMLLLTLTSYPVLHNWKWGQANTTFMALIVLSLALCERGLYKWAALALSLVVAARYYPAIYALALIARRRRETLGWLMVFATLLLVAVPILAMGAVHAWRFYLSSAASIEDATTSWIATSRASQYLPTTLLRMARAWHHRQVGSRTVWQGIAFALAACNMAAVVWTIHKRHANPLLWAFCFISLSTPLLVPSSWTHYFVYLPLAQTFVAAQLATLRDRLPLMAACYLLGWLPSAALSSFFFFEHTRGAAAYAFQGFLLVSNLALLLVMYVLLLLRQAPLTAPSRLVAQSA
jgi:Glycosyltransferase family 87